MWHYFFSFSTVLAACDKGCRNCVDGNCLECKAAYELDQESKQCEKKKGKSKQIKQTKKSVAVSSFLREIFTV